jgi:ubiquinone/menaquinone biosynthesis C-methylase UbiE
LSYIHNPEMMLCEFYRMLEPEGWLILSTMKPDCDLSLIFTEYISGLKGASEPTCERQPKQSSQRHRAAREMLNEVSQLLSLEEDGFFRFFSSGELKSLMALAGFSGVRIYQALGNPTQAIIAVGQKS